MSATAVHGTAEAVLHDHAEVEHPDAVPTLVEREPALVVGLLAAALAARAAAGDGLPRVVRGGLVALLAGGAAVVTRMRVTPWPADELDAERERESTYVLP